MLTSWIIFFQKLNNSTMSKNKTLNHMNTILVANIGTSDIAIEIEEFYIPIGFDRNERNIDYTGLTKDEKLVWEQELKDSYILEYLCPELGIEVKTDKNGKKTFSFRDLTERILEAYQKDEETWHKRIRPGRIWGVIKSALEKFKTKEVYIFVTDQPHPSDTIYLFEILEKWCKREYPNLTLIKQLIPKEIRAINQDLLLNYYYKLFNSITQDKTVLISIKGGTPQMQTALRIQAIASGLAKQLFIDPKLSIKQVLAGEASECELTSYWRYMRTQRYQSVKLLLDERWDFDGARQILKDWSKVLEFLDKRQISKEINLSNAKTRIKKIVQALNLGVNYLNLDYSITKESNPELASDSEFKAWIINQGEAKLLNLYTQCRIYWELEQVANFLARMSSFYESTLERLIVVLDGEKYFRNDKSLDIPFIRQEIGENLWNHFYNEQKEYSPKLRNYQNNPYGVKLDNRFSKRNFIDKLLIPHSKVDRIHWDSILESLKSLDFWAEQRNNLIHYSTGISKAKMYDLLNEGKKEGNNKAIFACQSSQICNVMASICQSELGLINKEYQNDFVGNNTRFYLYSDIKEWVFQQLNDDSDN